MISAPVFDVLAHPHEMVPCALCAGTDATPIARRDRYGFAAQTVQCDACGLRYLNPRMTAAGYAAFYRDGYRPLLTAFKGTPHDAAALEPEQWRYALDLSERVAAEGALGERLIDVGGSTGIVGRLFRARWGYKVTVIDPSPAELARALGCRTICASAEAATLPVADLALLCRTIEHLGDPITVLRRLRTAARYLIVDARDADLWAADGRYQVDHQYAFTRATLTRALDVTGWMPIRQWTRDDGRYLGFLCTHQE